MFDQQLVISLRHRVVFTRGALDRRNPALAEAIGPSEPGSRARLLVVLDAGLAAAQPALAGRLRGYLTSRDPALPPLAGVVDAPGGEASKNDPALVDHLLGAMHAAGLCRRSCVLAVGGGAVLDVAGYAAAQVHRGVPLARMPTTTLGQGDAGIGIKHGVNRFGVKNFLGGFAAPRAVVNDTELLKTLSDRDWRCGLAEAVKVAALKDAGFFEKLEQDAPRLADRDEAAGAAVWAESARLHLEHIAAGGDPLETGAARPLDFGHWSAHRLESLTGHALRHGEAVAIGLALDAAYATRTGLLAADEAARLHRLLDRLGFELAHPALAEPNAVLTGLDEFREHLGGRLTVTTIRGLGRPVDLHAIDRGAMAAAMEDLLTPQAAHR